MLITGHLCGRHSAVGDDISTVLHQPCAGVQRTGPCRVSAVLRGFHFRSCRSSGVRRPLSHCMVDNAHRNQQICRRLPSVPGKRRH